MYTEWCTPPHSSNIAGDSPYSCAAASQILKRLQRWRRESSMIGFAFRQKHTAEFRRGRSGDGGQSREARKKRDKVTPLCVFLCCTALQAVDIINISVVFLQRRLLSWLGVLIASVALRHWKLQEENDKHQQNADYLAVFEITTCCCHYPSKHFQAYEAPPLVLGRNAEGLNAETL